MVSSLVIYSAALVAAVIWGLVAGRPNVFFHPGHGLSVSVAWGTGAGIALGLAAVLLSRLSGRLFRWARRLHMEFHQLMQGLTWGQAILLALASAVGEEALFRGAMQPTLGLYLSAAIFGAAHFPSRRGLWPWPIMAFVLGLAFGVLFRRSGNLGGPIAAHFVINLLNLHHLATHAYPADAPAPPAGQPPDVTADPDDAAAPPAGQPPDVTADPDDAAAPPPSQAPADPSVDDTQAPI